MRAHDTVPFPVHQKTLYILELGASSVRPRAGGYTPGGALGPQSVEGPIEIYSEQLRFISPPTKDTTTVDLWDADKIRQTLAHEIGHGVSMIDWRKDTSNSSTECSSHPLMPARDLTVMVSCWFPRTTNSGHSKWTTIPHTYDQADLIQIRIKR